MAVLRGHVTRGDGDLSRWMRVYAAEYEAATGVSLYPGSLNLVLDGPWTLPADTLTISADRVGRLVHLVPCRVQERRCFIFRTDNAEQDGPAEQRVLEVLAEVRLRDDLQLDDGDPVEVVLDE